MNKLLLFLFFPAMGAHAAPPNAVDHAGILQNLGPANFARGKQIYNSLCINCHGSDGITASLPAARAFGKGELKFGADPYAMFRTLTEGRGMMGPQTWMTPQERYEVIHYIREKFMKPMHPKYAEINDGYLEGLPTVNVVVSEKDKKARDFGPALASQLGTNISSVLSIKLPGNTTLSYNLHSMDQAGLWQGGFLNLLDTQHYRERGGGVAEADNGERIPGLQTWQWAHDGGFDYPAEDLLPRGPMQAKWMAYRGHYVSGDRVVLSYTINGREILELPYKSKEFGAVEHTLKVGPGPALKLCVAHLSESNIKGYLAPRAQTVKLAKQGGILVSGVESDQGMGAFVAAALAGDRGAASWSVDEAMRLILHLPESTKPRLIQVARYAGKGDAELLSFASYTRMKALKQAIVDPSSLVRGGASNWPELLITTGRLGAGDQAYTLDTLNLPEANPWNAWLRTSALAFFPDGRLVVSTHGGDVWVVSGIDRELKALKWKRFAAGLYEPFGLQVVDGLVYVTCKDRITRLHDYNRDGEADFYESFSADDDVSTFFHAFNFDLQRDAEGNLYYAKSGQYTSYALPGSVIKVSPDGKKREVHCTGLRTPNGMGILPDGRVTVSDNQGNWMPASKISVVEPGGFYGYAQTHAHKQKLWAPNGGKIDHTRVVHPKTFDQPVIWMPQHFDNSSGGQLWVDDPRWGPLSGRMLHTSFGKGWLYYMMLQDVDGVMQAGMVKLNLDAVTGIHRARLNPADGQVYAVGLNGWNGHGRKGLGQGGIHRFRYTGKPLRLLTDTVVEKDGIRLRFNFKLSDAALQPSGYRLKQWNYFWCTNYGSKAYSLQEPWKPGQDEMLIEKIEPSEDGRSVLLKIPGIQPVNQVEIHLDLPVEGENRFVETAYLTINKVPGTGPGMKQLTAERPTLKELQAMKRNRKGK